MLAELSIEPRAEAPIARIAGEIDASNAADFTERLKAGVPNTALGLILDLSDTTYLDSSGVHLIFDLANAMRRRQQTLQLVVLPDTFVADVLEAVSLGGVARLSPTLPDALEDVKQPNY